MFYRHPAEAYYEAVMRSQANASAPQAVVLAGGSSYGRVTDLMQAARARQDSVRTFVTTEEYYRSQDTAYSRQFVGQADARMQRSLAISELEAESRAPFTSL